MKDKKKLRMELKKRRSELRKEYCIQADESIRRYAVSLPEYQCAETVFCYVGTEEEIHTLPLLKAVLGAGKRLGVPRCISRGLMEVCEITDPDELEPGSYGILEPREGCGIILPEEIDLAFVPCLGCTRDGRRLGYGGGFYDRYLEHTDCVKAALCREAQIEDRVPTEEHDRLMDLVISEKGIY